MTIGVGVLSLRFIIVLYGRTKAAVRVRPGILFLWLVSERGVRDECTRAGVYGPHGPKDRLWDRSRDRGVLALHVPWWWLI